MASSPLDNIEDMLGLQPKEGSLDDFLKEVVVARCKVVTGHTKEAEWPYELHEEINNLNQYQTKYSIEFFPNKKKYVGQKPDSLFVQQNGQTKEVDFSYYSVPNIPQVGDKVYWYTKDCTKQEFEASPDYNCNRKTAVTVTVKYDPINLYSIWIEDKKFSENTTRVFEKTVKDGVGKYLLVDEYNDPIKKITEEANAIPVNRLKNIKITYPGDKYTHGVTLERIGDIPYISIGDSVKTKLSSEVILFPGNQAIQVNRACTITYALTEETSKLLVDDIPRFLQLVGGT